MPVRLSRAAAGLLLALVGCRGGDVRPPSLIGLGDSYVSGVGFPQEVWLSQAARATGRTAVNLGVPGSLSRDAVERAGEVELRPRDAVVVGTGTNDLLAHGRDPAALEAYGRHLDELLEQVGGAGCRVVVPPLPLPQRGYALYATDPAGMPSAVAAYRLRSQEVARSRGAVHADVTASWDPTTMVAPDQLHPNPLGEATIAASVTRALALCPA